MPKYNHKNVTELSGAALPPGTYEAVVKRAENKVSKAARERGEIEPNMIELIVTVYGPEGERDVFDYLVFDDKTLYKVRHFCDSAGIDFERGKIHALYSSAGE